MEALVVDTGAFVVARARGDVRFNADDGFDTRRFAFFIKLDSAVHVAVVGEADGVHAVLFCQCDHLVNFRQPIKEGIVGVGVEVDEFRFRGGHMG